MSNLDTGGELPKKRKQSRIRERSAMWPEGSPLLMVHMTESVQAIERRLQRQMEGEHDFPRSDCLFFAMPPLSSLLTGVRHQWVMRQGAPPRMKKGRILAGRVQRQRSVGYSRCEPDHQCDPGCPASTTVCRSRKRSTQGRI